MNIIAVRHTSVEVPPGICYGQTDVGTASSFLAERDAVVQRLLAERFQAVYSSPLARCRRLADSISRGLPVVCDPRLMELDFGEWEGCRWMDISRTDEARSWFDDYLRTPCPGGESYQQLIHRVREFLRHIERLHASQSVLLVTHAGVIAALASLLSGFAPHEAFGLKAGYGSVTRFESR